MEVSVEAKHPFVLADAATHPACVAVLTIGESSLTFGAGFDCDLHESRSRAWDAVAVARPLLTVAVTRGIDGVKAEVTNGYRDNVFVYRARPEGANEWVAVVVFGSLDADEDERHAKEIVATGWGVA